MRSLRRESAVKANGPRAGSVKLLADTNYNYNKKYLFGSTICFQMISFTYATNISFPCIKNRRNALSHTKSKFLQKVSIY